MKASEEGWGGMTGQQMSILLKRHQPAEDVQSTQKTCTIIHIWEKQHKDRQKK